MRQIRGPIAALLAILSLMAIPAPAPAASPADSMLRRINAVRSHRGLHPLRMSGSLKRSARSYARYLIRQNYFGHASRIRASGAFRTLGEVLELHGGYAPQVGSTLRAWMHSPGHRDVLMSSRFTWIGLGRASGRFNGRRSTIWVGQLGHH
jgi:uncharacterized protein YkwD